MQGPCWFLVISRVWRPEQLVLANIQIHRFLRRLGRLVLWGSPWRQETLLPSNTFKHSWLPLSGLLMASLIQWILWWRMLRSLKDSKMQCRWFSVLIQSWRAQGYTDATAIVIARSCGSPLWRWMGLLGSTVVCLQCDLESRSPEVFWSLLCQAFTFCCCGRICTVTTWSLWRRFVCFKVDLCFWSCWLPVAGDGWSKLDLWSLRSLLLQDPQFKSFQPATVVYWKSGTLQQMGWLFTCSKLCFDLRMMHMDTVASCISMKPEDNNALTAWRLVNWVRCLGEDLPQCFFQSLVSMVDARWWKTLLDSVLPLLQFQSWTKVRVTGTQTNSD